MTRTMLFILGLVATGAALAPEARAQGGRMLNVGGTTVVLARSGGRYQGAQVPRTAAGPQFRPLSTDTRTAVIRTGEEALAAAAPGPALNRLSQLPGGVTVLTARPARPLDAGVARAAAVPAFRPLSAAARAGIVRAVTAEDAGVAPAAPVAPAATIAEPPFTLGPTALGVSGRGFLLLDGPEFVCGCWNFISFNNGGYVKVVNTGSKTSKYQLHFQVSNPSGASYEYTISAGDGTIAKVSAKPSGVQDIVVMLTLPPGDPSYSALADVSAGNAKWYLIGVEVTPL